jgi:hypothetical protein
VTTPHSNQALQRSWFSTAPFIVAVSLAIGIAFGWQFGGGDNSESTNVVSGAPVETWLFSQNAEAGEIRTTASGSLELVLRNFSPTLTAFTDRPNREVRIRTATWLVESWPDLFAGDPPNAALVEREPQGATRSVVVTLQQPQIVNGELRFEITVIDAEPSSNLARIAGAVHSDPVRTFAAASLFIDDVALTCALGGTCVVGDKGPGGGVVFYVSSNTFSASSACGSGCKYLEAAPTDLTDAPWAGAISAANGYSNNSVTDWYLPSKDELNEVYAKRKTIGGFRGGLYWSSTEIISGFAWSQNFGDGKQYGTNGIETDDLGGVRPIRAF